MTITETCYHYDTQQISNDFFKSKQSATNMERMRFSPTNHTYLAQFNGETNSTADVLSRLVSDRNEKEYSQNEKRRSYPTK